MPTWKTFNTDIPPPSITDDPLSFTLRATPSTDIWEIPPSTRVFTAPIIYQTIKLRDSKRARVTFPGNFKDLYSQAGLIMIRSLHHNPQWIKTGVEFIHGHTAVGTVVKASNQWPDWSSGSVVPDGKEVTVEIVRHGQDLKVLEIDGEKIRDKRRIIRDIYWAFDGMEDEEFMIGVYAAKPNSTGADVVVGFSGLVIETNH